MKNRILPFIILLLLMLTTGVFWGTWLSLARSMEAFSAAEFIHIGNVIIGNVAWPMRLMMIAAVVLQVIYLWSYPPQKSPGFFVSVKAFVLYVAVFAITLAVLVPMDNEIKTWTADTVPKDWEAIRDRWKLFHGIRTFLSLASMGSFASSLLFFAKKPAT